MPEVIPTANSVAERVAGILSAAGEPLRHSDLLRALSTPQRRVLPQALASDRFSVTTPATGGRLVALKTPSTPTQGDTMSTPTTPQPRPAAQDSPAVAPNGGAPSVVADALARRDADRAARPSRPTPQT